MNDEAWHAPHEITCCLNPGQEQALIQFFLHFRTQILDYTEL